MLNRKKIFQKFKWLKDKNRQFVISANYDGLICASFLSHFLNWELAGYYNMQTIWISETGVKNKKDLIWVDLDIIPTLGRTLGGHIIKLGDSMPKGYSNSCNPNILMNLSNNNFNQKYPLSTLAFLMWLYDVKTPNTNYSKFLILHSDSMWLKFQKYSKNFNNWLHIFSDYNWKELFENIDSREYEQEVDQIFYSDLINLRAVSGFGKLKSKYLGLQCRESKFNPDWDEDIILNLMELFANHLQWGTFILPLISKKIKGRKITIPVSQVQNIGISKFIREKKIFSYAITSPKIIKYTIFEKIK